MARSFAQNLCHPETLSTSCKRRCPTPHKKGTNFSMNAVGTHTATSATRSDHTPSRPRRAVVQNIAQVKLRVSGLGVLGLRVQKFMIDLASTRMHCRLSHVQQGMGNLRCSMIHCLVHSPAPWKLEEHCAPSQGCCSHRKCRHCAWNCSTHCRFWDST